MCQSLITEELRKPFVEKNAQDHERRREQHAGKSVKQPALTIGEARANRFSGDWRVTVPVRPAVPGVQAFSRLSGRGAVALHRLDVFFNAWEFAGKFPDILTDPVVGEAASSLYADARRMLKKIVAERWLTVNAVIGLWPANATDDDIEVYGDESRSSVLATLSHLRQQKKKPDGHAHSCLTDYVAPKESGVRDYIGGFAVTAGSVSGTGPSGSRRRTTTTRESS